MPWPCTVSERRLVLGDGDRCTPLADDCRQISGGRDAGDLIHRPVGDIPVLYDGKLGAEPAADFGILINNSIITNVIKIFKLLYSSKHLHFRYCKKDMTKK